MSIREGPPNSVAKTTAALTTQTVIDSSTGGAATSIKRSPTITTLEVVVVAVGTFSAYILESDVPDLRLRDLGMPSGGPSQRSQRSVTWRGPRLVPRRGGGRCPHGLRHSHTERLHLEPRSIPHQDSSPKTITDEVKEAIKKRVDNVENMTQEESRNCSRW